MADHRKGGLGSGLEAILGTDFNDLDDLSKEAVKNKETDEIPLDQIQSNPYQPRKVFDEKELQELADSIKEQGVFQPILVKQTDTGYVLLAGERRVRAAKLAGLSTIPAVIKDFTQQQMLELSLLENIQREDLSVIEEASSYQQLIEKLGYTQEDLAKRLGKSRTHVTNTLRLLSLPTEITQMVNEKKLTMGQVRPLVTIEDDDEKIRLAKMIAKLDLSARQAEMLAKKSAEGKKPKPAIVVDQDLVKVQRRLASKLGTKVKIKPQEISISYKGTDDLNRILELLNLLDD